MDSDQKYFFFYRHQHKGDMLVEALKQNGWKQTQNMHLSRASFFDIDVDNRVEMINTLVKLGQKVFIYPHGARPQVAYMWKQMRPHPKVTAYVCPTVGHAELLKTMDYPHRFVIPGWWLTPVVPFQALEGKPKKVLFAPLHPNGNGWLSNLDRNLNAMTLQNILKAQERLKFQLTIRHIHSLAENGLPNEPFGGIRYIRGSTQGDEIPQIRSHDLIVAHQTFGYKSVALGKPTVFMSEHLCPRAGTSPETFEFINEDYWFRHKHLYMFPFDINHHVIPPAQVMIDACSPMAEEKIADWRERFIGSQQFNGKLFSDEIERYCSE